MGITVRLKTGEALERERGESLFEIAKSLGADVAKEALAATVGGDVRDLRHRLQEDAEVEFLGFSSKHGRDAYRHTASHILAQAVKRLRPQAKLAIGPAIDNGFYYDFDVDSAFTQEDLASFEAEMEKIIKENLPIERFALPREQAIKWALDSGEPYKAELIEELPQGEEISFYRQGGFTDLCAGPHLGSTGKVRAVKLLSVAGAYWRGDEKNKMLQRVYGTAFPLRADLDAHLERIEEAKRRDHRKLGRELDLFDFYEEGPGFPFFYPKGMALRHALDAYWLEEHVKDGYTEIMTPIMLNESLWHRSGHWDHYKENMYFSEIDQQRFAIKPMNCPGGMLAYKRRLVSYRDLPMRVAERGLVHRHELSGALHGLMRVRCFTQDDAHLYMTPEQAEDEIVRLVHLIDRIYGKFGFKYRLELSTRPENSMGTAEQWESATNALADALAALGRDYALNPGDGAFYGPKIDFHLEDSIGRTWQCGTIQYDMQMPELFDLTYVAPDGRKRRPIMLHRTILGSVERFIGILTEHYAGAFPTWLAPVQAKVLTVAEKHGSYADAVAAALAANGVRVETDARNEKIGYKIREAQLGKAPYMLVVGDNEAANATVAVRARDASAARAGASGGAQGHGEMPLDAFIDRICKEISSRK